MPIQKENEDIVIVAKSFNPTIFSQLWLVRENIVSEAAFAGEHLFSPIMVNFSTNDFQMLIVPDRLQLTFSENATDKPEIIRQVPEAIVKKLSHTPFVAVGFNFRLVFTPNNKEKYVELAKYFIVADANPISDFFDSSDARFGFYYSKDFMNMRLKLDIKPTSRIDQAGVKNELLSLNFNFHKDLDSEDKGAQLLSVLGAWTESEKHCAEIANAFQKEWSVHE